MTEPGERLMSLDAATHWRRTRRGRVVLTNGVFDLLHPGHVDLLLAARRLGDVLIVAINSDASVRRLKGPQRPVRTAEERGYVLAALSMVDAVVVFEEDTPARLIERLTPDVLVKGGDYSEASVVGAAETRARGGEVHIIPLSPGHSTTSTLARFRDPDAAPPTDA